MSAGRAARPLYPTRPLPREHRPAGQGEAKVTQVGGWTLPRAEVRAWPCAPVRARETHARRRRYGCATPVSQAVRMARPQVDEACPGGGLAWMSRSNRATIP